MLDVLEAAVAGDVKERLGKSCVRGINAQRSDAKELHA